MIRSFLSLVVLPAGFLAAGGTRTAAFAQALPDNDHVAITFTGGLTAPATTFTQNATFEQYSETGTVTTTYNPSHRPSFDGGANVRVWKALGVGVAVSYFHDPGVAQVSAMVPNPLVFNQPRQVTGSAPTAHTEIATHIQAAYWLQAGRRVSVIVSGGPTLFQVDQDFVTDVAYSQQFPYTTATFESATTVKQHKSTIGLNLGAEIGWRLVSHLDLAGAVRYSRGSVEFPDSSTAGPITGGGVHIGGGVRLVF